MERVYPNNLTSLDVGIINKAFWLSESEKECLIKALHSPSVSALSPIEKNTLVLALCCIYYAERNLKSQGRRIPLILERILKKLRLHRYFCLTFGVWNVHICHAARFGYTVEKFKTILEDFALASEIVIRFIIEDIGLYKPLECILGEYVSGSTTSSIAGLQSACNFLKEKHGSQDFLVEDGIIGPKTEEALKEQALFFPSFFCKEDLSDEMIRKTLAFFADKYQIPAGPAIPQIIYKKRVSSSFKRFFKRYPDVPKYVNWGMEAYHYLQARGGKCRL